MTFRFSQCFATLQMAVANSALLIGVALPGAASAQEFPQKSIKIVVPYAAGGSFDVMTRQVAEQLGKLWNQPVIVENKTGAAGRIAADAVSNAEPDGYTALMGTNALMVLPALYAKTDFDPIKSFAPVSPVGALGFVFAVNPSVPAKTLPEFVKLAKAAPGKYGYASFGAGSTGHLTMEIFKDTAGIFMVHVPYRGEAPAVTEVIGGHVPSLIMSLPGSVQYVKAGKLVPLAVNGSTRSKQLPDTPTFAELGYKGLESQSWFGVMLPAKTPPAVVKKFNQGINQVLANPDLQAKMAEYGITLQGGTPEQLATMMKSDIERFTKVVREKHIQAE